MMNSLTNNLLKLNDIEIILASSSPRRKELLSSLGIEFTIDSPDIDESRLKYENPKQYSLRIAELKVLAGYKKYPNKVVIAADTAVFHGQKMLDKAKTEEDVRNFLSYLGGKNHTVLSSVAVAFPDGKIVKKISETKVKMKKLSASEINFYIQSGEGIGKAGGYAIQGLASTFITKITGSYSGVVGLPLYELSQILKGYNGK